MTVGSRRRVAKAVPFARVSAVAVRSPVASMAPAAALPPLCAGVLLLEDDPDRQFRMARLLSSTGLQVVGASSGAGAMALLSTWPVDLVLVAEALSGGTAAAMAQRIRAAHGVPVVILTTQPIPRRRKRDRLKGVAASVDLKDAADVHALLADILPAPIPAA